MNEVLKIQYLKQRKAICTFIDKCKHKKIRLWTTATQIRTQAPTQEMKKKPFFFSLAFALGFAFYTCEPEQHKRKVNT